MKQKKRNNIELSNRGATRHESKELDDQHGDMLVFDDDDHRIFYSKKRNDLHIHIKDKTAAGVFYTNQQIDRLNRLENGPATNEIANLIGIQCLRCGIRVYRILDQYYKLKIHSDAKFKEKTITIVRRREEICGQRPSQEGKEDEAVKWLKIMNEPQKEERKLNIPINKEDIKRVAETMLNEELLRKAISLFNSQPDVLRKLQWSKEEVLSRKSFGYPIHFLILFLGLHTMVKLDKRKSPPYALIGKFLKEQGVITYAFAKDDPDEGRRALRSSDVATYFIKAQKIRTSLNKFYQQCQNVYIAPLTLPASACNLDNSVIEAAIKAEQKLMVFADTTAANDRPSFSQLFPPFDEILPI